MKITLINSRGTDSQIAPFGLMYIASVLEKEHEVKIYDPLPEDYSFIDKIEESDVIGISFLTTEYLRAKKIAELVRDKCKYLVVGGVHVTALPKTVKEFNADFGVIGEGEYTFKELVEKLEKNEDVDNVKGLVLNKNGNITVNERRELIENLDDLPFPARHLLDYDWYLRPPGGIRGHYLKRVDRVMTSRGCPYNCIYCGSCNIFGRKTRRRSVENVIKEIKFLKEKYGIDGLWFLDDTFILDYDWVLEFCEEMKKLNLIWACQSRVDRIDENVLIKMKEAGCVQLEFGIESGSDKVLKALRKGTTSEMQLKAFEVVKKVGMKTLATIMIGNPEETKEDIELTRKQLLKLKPDFTHVFFITPFPGSDLYEMAIENEWIKDSKFSQGWDIRRAERPVMEINLKADELIKIKSDLQNSFFYGNYKDYLKRPLLVSKVGFSFLMDWKNLFKGFKQFSKTRRIDDLAERAMKSYRSRFGKEN